jgi:hypothetical protein
MSATKALYVIQIEAKDRLQLVKYLQQVSRQIDDGEMEGYTPSKWSLAERKR